MGQEDKFEFESMQDPQTIRDYLQSLIEGLERGRVVLATQDRELVLFPHSLLKFSVKAKRKSDGSKLTLSVSWKDSKREGQRADESISISS